MKINLVNIVKGTLAGIVFTGILGVASYYLQKPEYEPKELKEESKKVFNETQDKNY